MRRWRTRDRVGIDLVAVDQVADAIDRFGERYLGRIYSRVELADCAGQRATLAASLAARFAAKEAVRKVLRSSDGVPWHGIEIRRASWGGCEVHLDAASARLAEKEGITALSVSMSHEDGFAVAVVLAQCEQSDAQPETARPEPARKEPSGGAAHS